MYAIDQDQCAIGRGLRCSHCTQHYFSDSKHYYYYYFYEGWFEKYENKYIMHYFKPLVKLWIPRQQK